MDRPIPNSYWVIPGRLLAGEYPIGDDDNARTRLAQFRESGINYFIDLTEPGEMPAYRHLLPVHSKYLGAPLTDMQVPKQTETVTQLLANVRAAIEAKRRIYLHCRAGIGRTGMIIGCFLAEELGNGKKALIELNKLWEQSERSRSWPKIPQTKDQAAFVQRWAKLAKPTAV